jgi:hypothetical protein
MKKKLGAPPRHPPPPPPQTILQLNQAKHQLQLRRILAAKTAGQFGVKRETYYGNSKGGFNLCMKYREGA